MILSERKMTLFQGRGATRPAPNEGLFPSGDERPALLYVKNFASRPEIVRAKNRITSDTRLGDTPITDSEILRCNKTDRNKTDYNETDPILSGSDGMGVRNQLTS